MKPNFFVYNVHNGRVLGSYWTMREAIRKIGVRKHLRVISFEYGDKR